jgi:hypothetical protein
MKKPSKRQDVRQLTIDDLTITMVDPVVSADGSQWPRNAMVRYSTPETKTDESITVIGNFAPATFTVSGWRYPITFTTRALRKNKWTQLIIEDLTIHAGDEFAEIKNPMPMTSGALLRDLPIARILKAAAMISSFVATVKPHGIKLPNKTIYPASGQLCSALRLDIIRIGADIPQVDLVEMVTGSRKTKRENKPPIYSLTALREIAAWYKKAPDLNGRNGQRKNEWIAAQIGGNKNTVQQQITKAIEAGYIKIPKRKRVK